MKLNKLKTTFLLLTSVFLISSCQSTSSYVVPENKDETQYQIYLKALDLGYEDAYEDWIKDVQSEKVKLEIKGDYIAFKYLSEGEEAWKNIFPVASLTTSTPQKPSSYALYKTRYPNYLGSESEWMGDLLSGLLDYDVFHQVIFNADGGSLIDDLYIHHRYKMSEPLTIKEGYSLEGWYLESEKWNFTTDIVTESLILKAHWSPNSYFVNFNPNGGTVDTPSIFYTFNEAVILPTPTRLGFDFAGWEYDDRLVNDGLWTISQDITLKAIWVEHLYSLTLDYRFNDQRETSQKSFGQLLSLPTPNFAGHPFIGWTLDGRLFTDTIMPSRNLTLKAAYEYQAPIMRISTENNAEITSKEVYTNATFTLENTGNSEYEFTNLAGEIRGRGNSSWGLDKKPYRIKFAKKRNMFGSSYKAKSWILVANHSDKSLLRNKFAYDLSRSMNSLIYSPMAILVDVYLNGRYDGVYMFGDHNQVNEGRIDLPEPKNDNENPDSLGFFVEWNQADRVDPNEIGHSVFTIPTNGGNGGLRFEIKSPDPDDFLNMSTYLPYIQNITENAAQAIVSQNYAAFSTLIDIPSFIDYFLIQELFKNVDVGNFSIHYIKKPNDIKLYMSAIWDFDLSLGNVDYVTVQDHGQTLYDPTRLWATQNYWFRNLLANPTFYSQYVARWNELAPTLIQDMIDSILITGLEYTASANRNFTRWNILNTYIWPNPWPIMEANTYAKQIDFIYNYLVARTAYLNSYYNR